MEVTAFDIYVMGSRSIFMELTSFSEFFIITVRKWVNFSAGSRGAGGGGGGGRQPPKKLFLGPSSLSLV